MNKPRKTYHHNNLRAALVDAAIPILAQEGSAGLTLRGVARAAGVSHAAPYRHFRDKSALLEAVAAVGYRHLERACQTAARRHADDPRAQLIAAGMAYLYFVVEQPAISSLMFGGALAGSDSDELQGAAQAAVQGLERIVDNGKRSGLYVERPVRDLTLTALAAVHGLAMMISGGLIREPRWTRAKLRALGNIVAATVLDGLMRKSGGIANASRTSSGKDA